MPVDKGPNARPQPAEGRPGVQRRRQVAHRQPEEGLHGITLPQLPYRERFEPIVSQQAQVGSLGHRGLLPRSVRTQEETLGLPPLVERAPRLPAQSVRAVSSCCRLPALTPAPSATTASFSDMAIGSRSNSQKQLLASVALPRCIPARGSRAVWPQSCQPAPHRPTASATAKGTGNVSAVLRNSSAESRRPCQQAVPCQDPASSRAAMARRYTVRAANGSKATATQPAPDANTRASTGASQSRRTGREAEHQRAMLAADLQESLNGKSLGLRKKVIAKPLPPPPNNMKTLEQPKRSCLARAPEEEEPQAPLVPMAPAPASRGFSRQAAAAQAQHQSPALHCVPVHVADVQVSCSPVVQCRVRDELKAEATVPFFPECGEQAAPGQTQHQAPAMRSSAENDTDLKVPSGHIKKDVHFRDAVEEESETPASCSFDSQAPAAHAQRHAPASVNVRVRDAEVQVTSSVNAICLSWDVIEEEAEETDSSGDGEQEAAAQAESQAPALLSPGAYELAPQEAELLITREPLVQAVTVDQESRQQVLEPQNMTQILEVAVATEEKEQEENIDEAMSQTEVIAIRDLWVNPCVPELSQDPQANIQEGSVFNSSMAIDATAEAARNSQRVSPVPDVLMDTKLAASTLVRAAEEEERLTYFHLAPEEEEEQAPASPACGEQEAAPEAQSQVLALLSPGASEVAVEEMARKITEQVLITCVAAVQGASQQLVEHQEMTQIPEVAVATEEKEQEEDIDEAVSQKDENSVHNLWVKACFPELSQDPQANIQEGSVFNSSMAIDATAEAAGDLQRVSPVPDAPTETKLAASTLVRAAEEEDCLSCLHLAPEEEEQAPASPACGEQETAPEAQRQVFALLSPDASEVAVEEMARKITEQVLITCVAAVQGASQQLVEHQDMSQIPEVAVASEEKEQEEGINETMSQEEEISVRNLWVKPCVPELFQDPQADVQEGSVFSSSLGMGATAEAAGDLQSVSPIPAGPSEQAAAPQAQSHAPALLSPDAFEIVLEETARLITREVLLRAASVLHGSEQQPSEQQDMSHLLDVTVTALTPAAAGDAQSAVAAESHLETSRACLITTADEADEERASSTSGELQGESSTALVSSEAHEDDVTALLPQKAAGEAETSHCAPEAANEGDAGASASARESRHPMSEAHMAGTGDTEEIQAGVLRGLHMRFPLLPMAESLQDPERSSMAHSRQRLDLQRRASVPWLLGSSVERELQQRESRRPHLPLRRRRMPSHRQVVPGTLGEEADAEELEKKEAEDWEEARDDELSDGEEITISNLWVNPLVPELFQDLQADFQEGSGCPSSMGMDVTGEATGDLQSMSPVPARPTDTELAASTLGGAAEEGEHRTPLPPASQEEAAPASASLGVGKQDAAAQAQSQALLLSPNPYEVVPPEAALLIPEEPAVQAVDEGTSRQTVEYQDVTQMLDVTMAALTPAALEDIESAVSSEPQGEASAAVASPSALEDEVAAPLTPIPAAEAGTSHIPPGADDNGNAAASPLSGDSQRQGMVRRFVKKYLGKAVTVTRGARQRQVEEPDVAQSLDAQSASVSPAVVEDTEDEPGIATLPDPGAAPRRRLYRFRRALRALRKAFRFSCITPRVEE